MAPRTPAPLSRPGSPTELIQACLTTGTDLVLPKQDHLSSSLGCRVATCHRRFVDFFKQVNFMPSLHSRMDDPVTSVFSPLGPWLFPSDPSLVDRLCVYTISSLIPPSTDPEMLFSTSPIQFHTQATITPRLPPFPPDKDPCSMVRSPPTSLGSSYHHSCGPSFTFLPCHTHHSSLNSNVLEGGAARTSYQPSTCSSVSSD